MPRSCFRRSTRRRRVNSSRHSPARAGSCLSNAKNYRMEPDVPLVIPEVNAAHLQPFTAQRAARGWSGAIVTNANCAATVAAMALAPLHERSASVGVRADDAGGLGAGYPGVPSLDILGNVIPYIASEEPKIESEMQKMLGRLVGAAFEPASFVVSAHANRVAVENGHWLPVDCVRQEADGRAGARRDPRVARRRDGARTPLRAGGSTALSRRTVRPSRVATSAMAMG